jgi:DNA-binding IscR family transcriptional regulator
VCPINGVFIQVRDATLKVLESKTLEDIQEVTLEAIDFSI